MSRRRGYVFPAVLSTLSTEKQVTLTAQERRLCRDLLTLVATHLRDEGQRAQSRHGVATVAQSLFDYADQADSLRQRIPLT